MILERSLRSLMGKPYDPEELVLPTDEEALDLADLDTAVRGAHEAIPVIGEAGWPESVILPVRLMPVDFSQEIRQVSASYIANNLEHQSVFIYALQGGQGALEYNCCAGVDFLYEGTDIADFAVTSVSGDTRVLYRKLFPMPKETRLKQVQRHVGGGKWVISTHQKPEKKDEIPIFAYGGIYQSHMQLEQCVPVYATLQGSTDLKTLVVLKSQRFWHEKGVLEGRPARVGENTYYFHDSISKEESLSVSEAICNGYVRLVLEDKENKEERKIYHSKSYVKNNQGNDMIDLTFTN
jgi:hypothetical protein